VKSRLGASTLIIVAALATIGTNMSLFWESPSGANQPLSSFGKIAPLWQKSFSTQTAAAYGGAVIVGGLVVEVRSVPTTAMVFQASTGRLLWSKPIAELGGAAPPVITTSQLFAVDQSGSTEAIALKTGAVQWTSAALSNDEPQDDFIVGANSQDLASSTTILDDQTGAVRAIVPERMSIVAATSKGFLITSSQSTQLGLYVLTDHGLRNLWETAWTPYLQMAHVDRTAAFAADDSRSSRPGRISVVSLETGQVTLTPVVGKAPEGNEGLWAGEFKGEYCGCANFGFLVGTPVEPQKRLVIISDSGKIANGPQKSKRYFYYQYSDGILWNWPNSDRGAGSAPIFAISPSQKWETLGTARVKATGNLDELSWSGKFMVLTQDSSISVFDLGRN
jgi:hypothetical protein